MIVLAVRFLTVVYTIGGQVQAVLAPEIGHSLLQLISFQNATVREDSRMFNMFKGMPGWNA